MYFRNKFNEEFLYLADNISPKGGSVRLDHINPSFFLIEKPAFDEEGRFITVIPLLLYNRITSTNIVGGDKKVEDWIMLCKNKKDTVVKCWYDEHYISEQDRDYICNLNIPEITGDLMGTSEDAEANFLKNLYETKKWIEDPDYDYEKTWFK